MHYQSRNPQHERNHRISLMPTLSNEPQTRREKLLWCALFIAITAAGIAAHYGVFQ